MTKKNPDFDITVLDRPPKEKTGKKIDKPNRYKVILLNDDWTTMDFVVEILTTIFHHSLQAAESIMKNIHETGKGIAGCYQYEIAETKAIETLKESKLRGFPLQAILEPEDI